MKYILIILLFVCAGVKAQYIPNSGAYSYKGLMPLKSLQLPTGCGDPSTLINSPDSSRSAIYFDSCDAKLWRFDPKPKTWGQVTGSAGMIRDTAYLNAGWPLTIINPTIPDDSLYKPNGYDVTIVIDSNVLGDYIVQIVNGDTTIINNNDSILPQFTVDTLTGTPPGYATSGFKVLVAKTGLTGDFVGHGNEIAELVGAVWNFTVPSNNDQTLVDNERGGLYQYNASSDVWKLTAIFWQAFGNKGTGRNAFIGKKDKQPVFFRSWNKIFMQGDTTRNVFFPKHTYSDYSNVFFKPGLNGLLDTGHFSMPVYSTPVNMDSVVYIEDGAWKYGTATGGGGSQDLQSVTDIGYVTTNPLVSSDGITSYDLGGASATLLASGTTGILQFITSDSHTSQLLANNTTDNRSWQLPDVSGTLAESVTINGDTTHADVNGNIDLGTIGGGGSPLFPTTGTGTATDDVVGDLDGHSLTAQNASGIALSATDAVNTSGVFIYPTESTYGMINDDMGLSVSESLLDSTVTIEAYISSMSGHNIKVKPDEITISTGASESLTTLNIPYLPVGSTSDSILSITDAGQVKKVVYPAGGGGAAAFTDLTDVPSSYSGHALKILRVNSGETGVEFFTPSYLTSISGIAAGGDLSGTYPSPTVVGLRGAALPSLSLGYLKYQSGAWAFDSTYLTLQGTTDNGRSTTNNVRFLSSGTFWTARQGAAGGDSLIFYKGNNGASANGYTFDVPGGNIYMLSLFNGTQTLVVNGKISATGGITINSNGGASQLAIVGGFIRGTTHAGLKNFQFQNTNSGTNAYYTWYDNTGVLTTGTLDDTLGVVMRLYQSAKRELKVRGNLTIDLNGVTPWSVVSGVMNISRPYATNGSTPSITAGTGAGTSPTISVTGNDIAGYVTITTGTSPTASGNIVTITFATALTNTPTSIQLTPAGENAATELTKFYVDQSTASTTAWIIKNTASALTASTTYKFYYHVTQ